MSDASLLPNVSSPALIASDFDGVICDGLIEYFQTAWQAYCAIWEPSDRTPPEGLAERFYRLRPVIETGWEMPVLLRAVLSGMPDEELFQDWPAIAHSLIEQEQHSPLDLAKAVDSIRDEWIGRDVENWLAQHRAYPGVIDGLKTIIESDIQVVIVTTKEGRFVRQLLGSWGISLADEQIFGKEVKQPKYQTLRQLIQTYDVREPSNLWFIEDRLKTLEGVQTHADLTGVGLFLADWGYNTAAEREIAQQNPAINLLSLSQFSSSVTTWSPA